MSRSFWVLVIAAICTSSCGGIVIGMELQRMLVTYACLSGAVEYTLQGK